MPYWRLLFPFRLIPEDSPVRPDYFYHIISVQMKRSSIAVWHGSGKEGKGTITSQSEALDNAPYAWNSRFSEARGTNPEELIAAAHAGCFTMKLSFLLSDAGYPPDEIETTSTVTLK